MTDYAALLRQPCQLGLRSSHTGPGRLSQKQCGARDHERRHHAAQPGRSAQMLHDAEERCVQPGRLGIVYRQRLEEIGRGRGDRHTVQREDQHRAAQAPKARRFQLARRTGQAVAAGHRRQRVTEGHE